MSETEVPESNTQQDDMGKASLVSWSCRAEKLQKSEDSDGVSVPSITVGEKLLLFCEGEPIQFIKDAIRIETGSQNWKEYQLKLLEVRSLNETEATLVVTSYLPGEYPVQSPEPVLPALTDGLSRANLSGFNWVTASSNKPTEENPQGQQEPHPPFGPAKLGLPWIDVAYALGAVVLLIVAIGFFLRHLSKVKAAYASIKDFRGARNPIDDLYFKIRKSQKRYLSLNPEPEHFLAELDESYKRFLALQFNLPAHIWSEGKVVSKIKKQHPKFYKKHGDRLKRTLFELKVVRKKESGVEVQDAEQIMEQIKTVADVCSQSVKYEVKDA